MEIAKVPYDDSATESVWGGVFFHPVFVESSIDLLQLRGEAGILIPSGRQNCRHNILIKKRFIASSATIPLLYQYFGLLPLSTLNAEDFREIDSYIGSICDFAIFSLPPGFAVETIFKSGWEPNGAITLAFDHNGLKKWGSDFRDDVKNKIRKAGRESVRIEQTGFLPDNLWKNVFERKGIEPPLEPDKLRVWCSRLIDKSLLKIFAAKIDGELIAFRGELIHGEYAYDWIAGADPRYLSTGANQLLMADIGLSLADRGVKTWDLVGGHIKSIYDFKRSFGAKEVEHYHCRKSFGLKGNIFSALRGLRHGF